MSVMLTPVGSAREELAELVRAYVTRHWPTTRLMERVDAGPTGDTELGRRLAVDLDVVGIAVPEAYGGAGAGIAETVVVLEELGRRLYPGPFVGTVLAADIIGSVGDEIIRRAYLPAMVRGETTAAVAGLLEMRRGEGVEGSAQPVAEASDSTWVVRGRAENVADAGAVDLLVVIAQTPSGLRPFLVSTADATVAVTDVANVDLTRSLSTVVLDNAPATPLGELAAGAPMARRLGLLSALFLAAEAAGSAHGCLAMTVQYAGEREQFGRPVGSFQVIKHRCADVLLDVEAARATVAFATGALEKGGPEADVAVRIAAEAASSALYRSACSGVQVHGGYGYTWDSPMHVFLRRAVGTRFAFGSPEEQREEILRRHQEQWSCRTR